MEEKDKEKILTEYLQDLMKNNINQFMMLTGSVLKSFVDEANAGHVKITISDKKDKPIWTLLFATDEQLIHELDKFICLYDDNGE